MWDKGVTVTEEDGPLFALSSRTGGDAGRGA